MKFELLHPAEQLVMIMQRIYGYGMTTTSGGNLSILDDNGDIWITPGGVDKGALTKEDIIRVMPDGTIEGIHKPSVELPFHQLIYSKRKDIRAVVHAHPPALVSFSIVRKKPNTHLIPMAHLMCGEVGLAAYDVPGSAKLGEKVASVFEEGYDSAILENHGTVATGESLIKAFMSFETLDFCARIEIKANQIGTPISLSAKYLEISRQKQHPIIGDFVPTSPLENEVSIRKEMATLIHRAYDQQLFTSTQGTFSQRLDDNSFIITPYMMDRKYLEPEDLVLVKNGYKEEGKIPSRSVLLHKAVYEKHPDINSIIIAHPPNMLAFAVTECEFDSRVIPESYVLLRQVNKLPFGSSLMQPALVADTFSEKTPIVIIENDCIIVTGNSLLNAFDRLEVAEYSAKAIIASRHLGKIIMINKEQTEELDRTFNL